MGRGGTEQGEPTGCAEQQHWEVTQREANRPEPVGNLIQVFVRSRGLLLSLLRPESRAAPALGTRTV